MKVRSIPTLVAFVVMTACSDDGRGAGASAAASSTTTSATGVTSEATSTSTTAATTGATGSGGATTTAAPTTTAETTSSGTTTAATTESGGESSSGAPESSTGAESSGTSTGDDTTVGMKLDVGVMPDVGGGDTAPDNCSSECEADEAGQMAGDWLLHIGGGTLYRVNVADATKLGLCKKVLSATSLTFTRDNRLFSSSGSELHEIDPCTCEATVVGEYPPGFNGINGIAPDEGNGLFGFSSQANALVRIDPDTAAVTEVGKVGFVFNTHGAAWSEQDQTLYFLTKSTLYTVDTQTGVATEIGPLGVDFSTVGVEEHPATGELYGCTGTGNLYHIDKVTAQATLIGSLGLGSCTNLGAPWTSSQVCLPIPG